MKDVKSFMVMKGRGFHINFPNGIRLSTQIGAECYCEHYDSHPCDCPPINKDGNRIGVVQSDDAEIQLSGGGATLAKCMQELFADDEEYSDDILGYVKIDDWLEIVRWCMDFKPAEGESK